MQRFTVYKSARRKRKSRPGLDSVLVVLVIGTLVWRALRAREDSQVPDPARPTGSLAIRKETAGPAWKSSDKPITATRVASVTTPATSASVPSPRLGDADQFPRPARNVFEAQLALARLAISPGSIDGAAGSRTRLALLAFQKRENLSLTGELDAATRGCLLIATPPFSRYAVTAEDLARLRPVAKTWLEKSQQDRLDYESLLELVAEKAQSHPHLIRQINSSVDWTNAVAGTFLTVPDVERPPLREKAALARIHLEERTLEVFGESAGLLAHFPCSIARFAEKRPVGELHVATVALNPNYTFDPDNFPESAEARQINRKLILPPGPNNPVGTVWIGLDKPGYGIHGTPRPEQVGRAESHGCFRLANWNAEYFAQMVWVGMPVIVEP